MAALENTQRPEQSEELQAPEAQESSKEKINYAEQPDKGAKVLSEKAQNDLREDRDAISTVLKREEDRLEEMKNSDTSQNVVEKFETYLQSQRKQWENTKKS